jgi:hypothetical protein
MIKLLSSVAVLAVTCTASWPAPARAEPQLFPILQAMSSAGAQTKLDPGVKLFFGRQRHPPVAETIGVWPSNKRSNISRWPDLQACEWAFLSAVISLQKRARRERANAVVDIVSSYENATTVSETKYVCDTGPVRAGVALVGTVVILGK